jgi:hypothetical protein
MMGEGLFVGSDGWDDSRMVTLRLKVGRRRDVIGLCIRQHLDGQILGVAGFIDGLSSKEFSRRPLARHSARSLGVRVGLSTLWMRDFPLLEGKETRGTVLDSTPRLFDIGASPEG